MKDQNVERIIAVTTIELSAPPWVVFPLLCPVRECDWIDGWDCRVDYSRSGVAELNGIFTTEREPEGVSTWVISRYEPDKTIEFVILQQDRLVTKLDLYLSETGNGGTRMRVSYTLTPLNDAAGRVMHHMTEEAIGRKWAVLGMALEHYLQTGQRLPLYRS